LVIVTNYYVSVYTLLCDGSCFSYSLVAAEDDTCIDVYIEPIIGEYKDESLV